MEARAAIAEMLMFKITDISEHILFKTCHKFCEKPSSQLALVPHFLAHIVKQRAN